MAVIKNLRALTEVKGLSCDYGTAKPRVGDPPDWVAYQQWFLGRDETLSPNVAEAWSFPIGDGTRVSSELVHQALILARAQELPEIEAAAETLLNEVGYVAMTQDGNQAELLIYGDIGGWDTESVQAMQVVQDLRASTATTISVRINSFGGSVSDGLAIFNALHRHTARVVTYIDGVAASIASLIAMAGDVVEAAASSMLMIHAPWTLTMGSAKELRATADVLDVFSTAMAAAYASRLGKKEALGLLTDGVDHWYAPHQALAVGLVDTIGGNKKAAASSESIVLAAAKTRYINTDGLKKVAAASRGLVKRLEDGHMVNTDDDDNVIELEKAAEQRVAARLVERNALAAKVCAPFMEHTSIRTRYETFITDPTASLDELQIWMLAEIGRDTAPVSDAGLQGSVDEVDKFRTGAAAALAFRAGVGAEDKGSEYRGSTLLDMAGTALRLKNISMHGLDKMGIVAAAFTHTGSDFPLLLADVANKSIMKGWDEQPETFQSWTATGSLSDFKASKRVDLNLFPALTEVPDGGEYTYGTIGEHGESIQLATYGKLFSITRRAIINDDLNEFSRIPQRMGRAAKRTIGNLVYAIITGNPLMSDGVALFDAAHNNLLTAAAINTASLDVARASMQTQKDPDGMTALNIRPSYLLVPAALQGTAATVIKSQVEVPTSGKNFTTPNSVAGMAEVISDARLDDNSPISWYVLSGPTTDTIEVDYLDGQDRPHLEQQQGWEVDGVAFKVRIDAGVKALDFRGMVKNPGV